MQRTYFFPRRFFGAAAAVVAALLFAGTAVAATDQELCETEWGRSAASNQCPNPTISAQRKGVTPTAYNRSCWVTATCSVTVRVGEDERTFSRGFHFNTVSTEDLRLCFRSTRNSDGGLDWTLRLKARCYNDTDLATAEEESLAAR